MTRTDDDRVKQIAVGAGILLVIMAGVCGVLLGWRHLPGLLGEWIGLLVGLVTTPVFLETFFVILGLTVVVAINHWRQKRDGDELVYLEQVEGDDVPGDLPEQAKWAVYRERPMDGEEPSLLELAEGCLSIGDFESAGSHIGAMNGEELRMPETLALRIELAKATGRESLVPGLERELRLTQENQG